MELKNKLRQQSTMSFQVIIAGFMGLIIVGALLLMLPIASKDRTVTSFSDTLFTAVSATCVTGLVVRDTATHWSMFGQAIILFLIQIGGMGVITISMAIVRLSGKKIGLWQRSTM
ncbi:MAG: potassium transporter TrkG, partial [Oscillospiraceae bacterium]